MTTSTPPWIPAEQLFARVGFGEAVRAVQRALVSGLDPADDLDRSILNLANGHLLFMPTESRDFVGVKLATVTPGNPAAGKDRVQGVYLLLDSATLSPLALLDGAALTTLRTPAVSAVAADHLAPAAVDQLVVFGSGPQAWGHFEALRTVRSLRRVVVVARDQARAGAFATRVAASGIPAHVGSPADVRDAQLIVCATTSREPLFDGSMVPDDCCSIAVGSHEPDKRELDSLLLGRAQVVVETPAVALREAGDIVIPVSEGNLDPGLLVPIRNIVTGSTAVDQTRPRVFKSCGMSWEDLVIAAEVYLRGDSTAAAVGPPGRA